MIHSILKSKKGVFIMKKRLMVLFLAVTLAVSNIQLVLAADTSQESVKQIMTALEIISTDSKGNLNLSKKVTRAQFAQMLVLASSYKDKVSSSTKVSMFKDVSYKYWGAPYIKIAVEQGYMSGYLDGSFKPTNYISLQEAVKGVTKLLGYGDADFSGSVMDGQMALYQSKKLDKNLSASKRTASLTKSDCMNLLYNTLLTTTKEEKIYAQSLGYTVNTDGTIDYLTLVGSQMSDPMIATSKWSSQIPFKTENATIYRNGKTSKESAISLYDVLYYSKSLKTIWAYSTKVTGSYEAVSPNQLAPTEITVAGKTYGIGSQTAAYQLSTLGSYELGDSLTLLLGKDGTIVGIMDSQKANTNIFGIVQESGSKTKTDKNGGEGIGYYVKIIDSTGTVYQYDCEKSISQETLVQVSFIDGESSVSALEKTVITGTINSEATKIAATYFAKDINILDLNSSTFKTIQPSRLAGVTLYNADILYCQMNGNGEITDLILNNVTGDLYQYGVILTSVENASNGNYSGNYSYDIGGTKYSSNTSQYILGVKSGPAKLDVTGNSLSFATNLTRVSVVSINGLVLQSTSDGYTISDQAAVYLYDDITSSYYYTTLSKISNLDQYTLSGYYDKSSNYGGRIRVITAVKKNMD